MVISQQGTKLVHHGREGPAGVSSMWPARPGSDHGGHGAAQEVETQPSARGFTARIRGLGPHPPAAFSGLGSPLCSCPRAVATAFSSCWCFRPGAPLRQTGQQPPPGAQGGTSNTTRILAQGPEGQSLLTPEALGSVCGARRIGSVGRSLQATRPQRQGPHI